MKDTKISNVKSSYNKIADHFSDTRKYIWPEMAEAANMIKDDSDILDIGCGNGRFTEALKDKKNTKYLGIDLSKNMIENARRKNPNDKFEVCNILDFQSNEKFDHIVSFAMFHHLNTEQERLKMLAIIHNSLNENGRAYITVWNMWNKKRIKYVFKNIAPFLLGKAKSIKDTKIPWKDHDGKLVANRNYYAFTMNELKKLFDKSQLKLEEIYLTPDKSNYLNARNIVCRVSCR